MLVDSDGDGLSDAHEDIAATLPLQADTDDDGLNDRIEWDLGRATDNQQASLNPRDRTDSGCFVAR